MIVESYVTYETAKLLDELGLRFHTNDGPYWKIGPDGTMYYMSPIHAYTSDENNPNAYYRPADSYPCPTQAIVMRWLREAYKIDIDVDVYSNHSWNDSTDYCINILSHGHTIIMEKHEVFNTYEDACEAAIKYCLKNLIPA